MFVINKIKNIWNNAKPKENSLCQSSHLLSGFIGILEDVLFWRKPWLSLYFIFMFNLIFFVCVQRQVNMIQFVFCISTTLVSMDGFESWLKYKHRTSFLKNLSTYDGPRLRIEGIRFNYWLHKKANDLLYIRQTNHPKAFLLMNLVFGFIFVLGHFINGYLLLYLLFMLLFFITKIAPPVYKFIKNIQQNAESYGEFDDLIPRVSEMDIKLLAIDPDLYQPAEDNQSLDWKSEDLPIDDGSSDSSEHSSSVVTNLSIERVNTLQRTDETSDSSEDEEYMLLGPQEQLQSTLEIVPVPNTYAQTAYNALRNLTGAMTSIIYPSKEYNRVNTISTSSSDASNGFEVIDKMN